MTDCLFCKIINGSIPSDPIYSDDQILAFNDAYPKAPVHILVVPRQHIASLQEIGPEDSPLLGYLTTKIPEIAKAAGLTDGFKTQINTGKSGGQEIFHLHYHILGTPTVGTPTQDHS